MRCERAPRAAGRVVMPAASISAAAFGELSYDVNGKTLASASSLEAKIGVVGKNNMEASAKVGAELAARAKKAGVEEVYFDRGGFLYHGKVKALADAAREGGLKF